MSSGLEIAGSAGAPPVAAQQSGDLLYHEPEVLNSPVKSSAETFISEMRSVERFISSRDASAPVTAPALFFQYAKQDASMILRSPAPNSPAAQGVGITTSENMIGGSLEVKAAWERFKTSSRNRDKNGAGLETLAIAQGTAQAAGGATYFAYRGTNIATQVTKASTSQPVGKANYMLGSVGNALFGIFYAFIGIASGIKFKDNWKFRKELKAAAANGDQALIAFLKHKLVASPQKAIAQYQNFATRVAENQEGFKNYYRNVALDQLTEQFLRMQEELGRTDPLSKEQVKQYYTEQFDELRAQPGIAEEYLRELGVELDEAQRTFLTETFRGDPLVLIGLAYETRAAQSRKFAKFSRMTDGNCAMRVKNAFERGLATPQAGVRGELDSIRSEMLSLNKKNLVIQGTGVAIGVIGVAMSILGVWMALPAVLTAYMAISTFLGIFMLVCDSYAGITGVNQVPPGKWDKAYIVLSMIFALVGFTAGAVITLMFGFHILPLIIAGVFTLGFLVYLGFVLKTLIEKEKRWNEEHLSLQGLSDLIGQSPVDYPLSARVSKCFKNLSKGDRTRIREMYLDGSQQINDVRTLLNSQWFTDQDRRLLERACSKSIKHFWSEYHRSQRSDEDRERVIQAEGAIREFLAEMQGKFLINDAAEQFAQFQAGSPGVYAQVFDDFRYVTLRERSEKTLKTRVDALIQENETASRVAMAADADLFAHVHHKVTSEANGLNLNTPELSIQSEE